MNTNFVTLNELHQFDSLELLARQVVEGFMIGLHKSPFHGFSVEFAEHRLYNIGDSLKNVDWKVYARTDKVFVKRYEEETNLRCQLVIDCSSSMFYPENPEQPHLKPINKFRFSAAAAAAVMHLLKKQRDAVGLSLFSDEVEAHTPCKSTTIHHNLLISTLERYLQKPPTQRKTSAAKCLHEIADNIHKRSLVLIFSDMLDEGTENEALFAALQHLKYNKHEVVLFHVVDGKHEMEFEFENRPYRFIDMENGEEVRLQPNQVRGFYVEQMEKFKKNLQLKCAQYRIDFVEADINKDFTQVLLPYLSKRTKLA